MKLYLLLISLFISKQPHSTAFRKYFTLLLHPELSESLLLKYGPLMPNIQFQINFIQDLNIPKEILVLLFVSQDHILIIKCQYKLLTVYFSMLSLSCEIYYNEAFRATSHIHYLKIKMLLIILSIKLAYNYCLFSWLRDKESTP